MSDETPTPPPSYPPPVDRLLTEGDARPTMGAWPDYRQYSLGPEHIPDLIRMATDPALNWANDDTLEVWAPVHAWRALGQLRAVEAVEPLLTLHDEQDDSDWVLEELPEVYGLIGPPAIPALAAYLADDEYGAWARVAAASGLEKIGQQHPAAREASVAALSQVLEQYADNDEILNGALISNLIHLKAVEAAPIMERAFAADSVDELYVGDWEDVQVALGLLEERLTPPPVRSLLPGFGARAPVRILSRSQAERPLTLDDDEDEIDALPPPVAGPARPKDARKAKTKRKIAAQSRRQNKKRK